MILQTNYIAEKEEDRCIEYLNRAGFKARKNNEKTHCKEVDIILPRSEGFHRDIFIDAQFSTKFRVYGDIRIDAVSIFAVRPEYSNKSFFEISRMIDDDLRIRQTETGVKVFNVLRKYLSIQKLGKYFLKGGSRPHYVMFTLYNQGLSDDPDLLVLLKTDRLVDFIRVNGFNLAIDNRFKLNSKQSTGKGDKHGSAFFAVPLSDLIDTQTAFYLEQKDLGDNSALRQFFSMAFSIQELSCDKNN